MTGSGVDGCGNDCARVALGDLCAAVNFVDGVIDAAGSLVVIVTLVLVADADSALVEGSVAGRGALGCIGIAVLDVDGDYVVRAALLAGSCGDVAGAEGRSSEKILVCVGIPLTLGDGLVVGVLGTDAHELVDKALELLDNSVCIDLLVLGLSVLCEADLAGDGCLCGGIVIVEDIRGARGSLVALRGDYGSLAAVGGLGLDDLAGSVGNGLNFGGLGRSVLT